MVCDWVKILAGFIYHSCPAKLLEAWSLGAGFLWVVWHVVAVCLLVVLPVELEHRILASYTCACVRSCCMLSLFSTSTISYKYFSK